MAVGFLLCGLIRPIAYSVPFLISLSQLFCGSVSLLWALSVKKRVTDGRLRRLLLCVVFWMVLFIILQVCRYNLLHSFPTVYRYSWYAYYLPMGAVPLCCFLMAMAVHRPSDAPLPRVCRVAAAMSCLLTAGVLTNDLHHLAFTSPNGPLLGAGEEVHGPVYWAFSACVVLLFALSLFITGYKCRQNGSARYRWVPALPLIWTVAMLALTLLRLQPRLGGVDMYKLGEIFCIGTIGYLEACIQVGLIPANVEYDRLFSLSGLPAAIVDGRGNPVYVSAGAGSYPFTPSSDVRICRHPISGGKVEYTVSMEHVQALNRQLQEAASRLEARNAYLSAEYHIRRQKAEVEMRTRLYDQIYRIVEPQLNRIGELLDKAQPGSVADALPRIAVLCAYVKRRSNMEILAASGILSSEELGMALSESLQNIRLLGTETAMNSTGSALYPAKAVIAAYEWAEQAMEHHLGDLRALLAVLRAQEGRLTLRLVVRAGDAEPLPPHEETAEGVHCALTVDADGGDVTYVLIETVQAEEESP